MARWSFPRTLRPGAVRPDSDADIRDELEFYLEMRTQELVRDGRTLPEARREAEARFGNLKEIEARLRTEQGRRQRKERRRTAVNDLWQDLRFAVRGFRHNRGFAVVVALTLALAVAGNTAIFSVLDSAVLSALPFPDSEELVFLNGYHLNEGQVAVRYASIPEFRDWRERSKTVSAMVAVDPNSLALTGDGQAERITGELVSEGFFRLLGDGPLMGRTFTGPEFETPDAYPIAVISHGLWERRFGADPQVLGRELRLNERAVTVIGVMPEGFRGIAYGADVWLPLGMISLVASADLLESRGTRFLRVFGRLAPGASMESAQTELDGIARELQSEYPSAHQDRYAQLQSFREGYLGDTGRLLWILLGAGALLLAIAAANVANLLLVRSHARARELVVRRAVGANGGRVARQLLTESLLLAVVGGSLGLVLAWGGIQALTQMVPEGVLPPFVVPSLSPRVFLFSLLVMGGSGLAAGMAPAVSSARVDLAGILRAGARNISGRRAGAQQLFVVTQVGLALLLLVGAGLLTKSFRAQLAVDTGMEMEGVHVFRLDLPRERYPDPQALRAFTDELTRRVESVPGLTSVAASSDFPFRGRSVGSYIVRQDDVENLIRYHRHVVTPGLFQNLEVKLLRGRGFDAGDSENAPGVAVVTQSLVERVFPEDPNGVGRIIYFGSPDDPENAAEIVGVVEDMRFRNLTQGMMEASNSPDVFFPIQQLPSRSLEISYRASGEAASSMPGIREAVASIDAAIPIYAPTSLLDAYRAQTATPRFAAFLMGTFSLLALLLACIGIYGVLAFTVGQRASEIAVRRALGARATHVAGTVVWGALKMALAGIALGGAGALVVSRTLRTFLFQVEPTDPKTFAVMAGAMFLVAAAAAVLPAFRATRRDPVDALNAE